ncbi:Hha toxicity modulator TomB [Providencia stuartii]|uniref:Hha toxicity attenuator n=2 Tax=Providencia TaxID=586 RepID=A0A1S1HQU8_PROST|nr:MULTISPECIES: Hha toxicity modulator TomB [Providencia]MDV5228258.1 Hha toxicity modulator TomB [Providencia rettgeri]ELR5113510.1 Hha toxicity modulator TomB [Providencia stuartii]ELR5299850.1 Hha toxicity modulator TomB [Providencia stuartii]MDW7588923.1 Hha toxicity modulator TomB [Providencia sp. 2023EL-00965]MDX4945573.1 Hha toxicity modulator TomB [Providencia manganoxydans]
MDEYSPKNYDISELKYLCNSLNREAISSLQKTNTHWVNDLSSPQSASLNELIEHIAAFVWQYKIKYPKENLVISLVEEYLDETYDLFGSPVITLSEIIDWQSMNQNLVAVLDDDLKCPASKT